MQTISFLETAIVSITLALIFYTIGTWAERLQKTLKIWHVVFFLLGLTADTLAITGLLALILMAVHAIWAIWTYWRGSEKAKQNFSKFSVFVWAFWLIPYIIGAYLGSSH